MGLGAGLDFIQKGKLRDIVNVNTKPTSIENLYQVDQNLNMMHRRNKDEYPEYGKDGSFTRAFVDPRMSPTKAPTAQEILKKASLVNMASSMKAKNNAQYLQQLVQSDSYSNSKFELIRCWNIAEVDYRVMFNFKNALYGSPHLTETNQIPVSEFIRIRSESESTQIKNQVVGTEEALI